METPTSKTQNQLIKKTDLLEKTVYRSLSDAQATSLLTNGMYEGINVPAGEIFACEDGSFKKYTDEIDTSGSLTQTINQLSIGYFLAFKEPDEDYPNGIVLQGDYGTVRYSYDRGVTWSNAVSITGGYSYCFVVRDAETQVQKFVVVIETGSSFTVIKSVDGADWTPAVSVARDGYWGKDSPDTKFNPTNYVVDNKMFMFFSNSANRFYIYSADEGATWVRVDLPAMVDTGGFEDRNPVVLCNGTLVMFQALGKYALFTSTNGLTWTNTGVNFNSVNYYGDYKGAGNFTSIWDGSTLHVFDVRTITASYVGAFSFAPQLLYAYGEMSYLLLNYQNGEVYSADEATAFDFTNPKFTGLSLATTSYSGNGTELNGDTFVIKNAPDAWTPARANTALIDVAASHNRSLVKFIETGDGLKILPPYNFEVVGNPTLINKVLSNITSNDYLKFVLPSETFSVGSSSWKVKAKVRTPSNVSTEATFFDNPVDQVGFRVGITGDGKWQFLVSNNGWIDISNYYGTYSVQGDTDYWLEFGFDTDYYNYYLKYSTDGQNYTNDIIYNSTIGIMDTAIYLLSGWTGLVYLEDVSIEKGGSVWSTPYSESETNTLVLDVATNKSNAPTSADEGYIGKLWITSGGSVYICTGVSGSTYTWHQISLS